jgi:hypothetical protein
MRQSLRILFTVAFCVLLVGGIGCSRSHTAHTKLSGRVTAAGTPVPLGRVTFQPIDGGTTYTQAIRNGSFTVSSRYPIPPGQYDVTLEYSGNSRVGFARRHTERVTVGPLGRNTFDFHLK